MTCLVFDVAAVRLVSGAKVLNDMTSLYVSMLYNKGFPVQDNDVILRDVVNECGLSGHKAPVTDCIFMTTSNVMITRY